MNSVDILIHLHPDLSDEQRSKVEDAVGESNGVMHVKFNDKLPHELSVSYNPDAISVEALRRKIRDWDKDATLIGL